MAPDLAAQAASSAGAGRQRLSRTAGLAAAL